MSDDSNSTLTAVNGTLVLSNSGPNKGKKEIVVVIPDEKVQKALEIAAGFNFATVPGTQLVTFGQDPIVAFSKRLDLLLQQITKANSPILFELFRQVSNSVDQMDLPALEADIRKKLEFGLILRILMATPIVKNASWVRNAKTNSIEKATEEIRALLLSKATSLLDIIKPMEAQVGTESSKLVREINNLADQAIAYRENSLEIGMYVLAGRQIMTGARAELLRLEGVAQAGSDPLLTQDAKQFATRVELFENRLIALETAYVKAPVDLESIGIATSAGLLTLADTISSSQSEFNDIKSALLRLNAVFQIRSLQQLNQMRRQLRADLQKYMLDQLETAAITATTSAADARLESAQLLVGVATTLSGIYAKVAEERKNNVVKFEDARQMLTEAQTAIAQLEPTNQPVSL